MWTGNGYEQDDGGYPRVCDGRCLYASDLGISASNDYPAYPDPYCSLHGEEWGEDVPPEEEEMLPEDTGRSDLTTEVRIILAGLGSTGDG